MNKTSFAKIVVLPQDADYDFQPKVQAGTNHTITVRYDGSVWGFGVNTHGQLGTGNTDTSDKPVAAFTTSKIYVDADAGYDHTLLLDKNGVVWAAGNNDRGQLGITTADGESHIFTRVNVDLGVGEKFVSIAAGNGFSMALTNKGNVYAWGDNTHGQLGLGDETEVATPKKLAIANVRQISVGEDHTLFLQMNGTVYATGNYKHNKLGIYNLSGDLRIPTKVPSFLGASVVAVSAGTNHSLALYYTTNAASFGDNSYGQLGNGNLLETTAIQTVEASGIFDISAGYNHSMVTNQTGTLYVFGDNSLGQLGLGGMNDGTIQYISKPTANEMFLSNVYAMSISAGNKFSTFADRNGVVYGFGDYTQGNDTEFGLDTIETRSDTPVMIGESRLVAGDNEVTVVSDGDEVKLNVPDVSKFNLLLDYNDSVDTTAVSINGDIADARIDENGDVYVSGKSVTGLTQIVVTRTIKNSNGTSAGSEKLVYFVTNIEQGTDENPSIVAPMTASGRAHTIVLKQDGSVWAFGSNTYGQLGIGTVDNVIQNVPQRLTFFDDLRKVEESSDGTLISTGENVVKVYAREYHSVALTDKGNVYTWGLNNRGQLGLGYDPSVRDMVMSPERVSLTDSNGKTVELTDIVKVSVGTYHTVALSRSGIVYAWGWNDYGQIGNDSNSSQSYSSTPVIVKSLNKVVDISRGSGGQTVYAIRYDGSVWAWGSNDSGQIDVNSINTKIYREPTEVKLKVGNTDYSNDVVRIYTGLNHSAALLNDGNVITWGENNQKQLGREAESIEGTTIAAPGLVDKSNLTGSDYIVSLEVGATHNVAILGDQNIAVWGDGADGRLGLGDPKTGNGTADVEKPTYVTVENASAGTRENLQALAVSTGGAFTIVSRSMVDTSDPKNGMVYGFGINDIGQLALGRPSDVTNSIIYEPAIIAGDVAEIKPSAATMSVNDVRKVTIKLPRFYVTTTENTNGGDYIAKVVNIGDTTGDIITYDKTTQNVTGVSIGTAMLIVTDNETPTELDATFTVIAEQDDRVGYLYYDIENPEKADEIISTAGEVQDTDWFLDKGFLTYGTDYTIETATDETGKEYNAVVLKGGITQLYSVVTPISKTGEGSLRIRSRVMSDSLTLRDADGNAVDCTVEKKLDENGEYYYQVDNVKAEDVTLYYLDFTNDDKVRTTKLAIIGQSSDATIHHISVTPVYNKDTLNGKADHTYYDGATHIPAAVLKEDGTVDYYYYIAPDTDSDNNPLVGATVYIDGQKASIVSIASIPVNSDHTENEYHGKYFDAQNIAIGTDSTSEVATNGNFTATKLTVTAQDGTTNDYILYIYKESYATSIAKITVSTDSKTYTAVKAGENRYQVIVPENVTLADITTYTTLDRTNIAYRNNSSVNPDKEGLTSPAVYEDFVIGTNTLVTTNISTTVIGGNIGSGEYILDIIKVKDEDDPYVAVDHTRIMPSKDGTWYIASVDDDAENAVITVSTILEGGQVKIGNNGKIESTISEVTYVLDEKKMDANGYEDVPFTIFPKNDSPQEKTIRIYKNSADPRLNKITVTVYDDANGVIETVDAYYDIVQQQYVALIDNYEDDRPILVEARSLAVKTDTDGNTVNAKAAVVEYGGDLSTAPYLDVASLNSNTNGVITNYSVGVEPIDTKYSKESYKLAVIKNSLNINASAKTDKMNEFFAATVDADDSRLLETKVIYSETGTDIKVILDQPYEQVAVGKFENGDYKMGQYKSVTSKIADGEKPYIVFSKQALDPEVNKETNYKLMVKSGSVTKDYILTILYVKDDVTVEYVKDVSTPESSRYTIVKEENSDKEYQYYLAIKQSDYDNDKSIDLEIKATSSNAYVTIASSPDVSDEEVSYVAGKSGKFEQVLNHTIRVQDYITSDDTTAVKYLRFKVTGESGFSQVYKLYIKLQSADTSLDGGIVKAGELPSAISDEAEAIEKSTVKTNYNKTTSNNNNSDAYDTEFDGYFITVSDTAKNAAIRVVTKDDHASVAIGKFLAIEDYAIMSDNSANVEVKKNYISSLSDSDYSTHEKKIEAYDLTDGNRYNLTAGVSADLRKGIFVPIVIKAENGKTDISYLMIRGDKSDLTLKNLYVNIRYSDGTSEWTLVDGPDSITGEYSVGIPNNMTSIDIKAIANRSDIISLLVGENTADEGEDGEDTDTSETPDTPSERSWIETLKLDLDTSVYPLVYNGTNVDKDSGERIKIGQAIDPDSQTTVVKIYLYADNGTMITNEDAPIILNINKKSEDANISSVTINPDTVYENSDSTERLDENQIPGFTVFANEDLDNPEKESYTEAFTVKLSSPKAKLTID